MRNALIIGAGGQDGRLLTRHLLARDYAVHGWTRTKPTHVPPCEHAQIDLSDPTAVELEIRNWSPDEIYYLAAFHHSTEEATELSAAELTEKSFAVHVTGLQNVLEALKSSSSAARIFYAASSHVFGPATADSQSEETPFAPTSPYGISKAAGIECCRRFRKEGVFAASGILFNHESSLRKTSFLSQKVVQGALRARGESGFRLILGDLEARVDWGFAPDYVDAMRRILQLRQADDFVIASGETHTVREFANAAFAAVGLDWRDYVGTDSSLLKRNIQPLCGDTTKLRRATGWAPSLNFVEMVAQLVQDAHGTFQIG